MEVQQTSLPGVGVRYDLTTRAGRQLAVLSHLTGRHDLLVYDRDDPDTCQEVIQLTESETDTIAELLGAARIVGRLGRLQQKVEGLAIDWLPINPGSPYANGTIADTQARSRTGVSIVAVLRDGSATPAPTPDFRFAPGDNLVVVGTPGGVRTLAELLGD
jgi:TrkA domain protein